MVSVLNAIDKMSLYDMPLIYVLEVLGLGRAFSMLWLYIIELDLGRGIKPFGTDILPFSLFLLYRGDGCTVSLLQNSALALGRPIDAPLFIPALCSVQSHFVIGILSRDPSLLVSKWFKLTTFQISKLFTHVIWGDNSWNYNKHQFAWLLTKWAFSVDNKVDGSPDDKCNSPEMH